MDRGGDLGVGLVGTVGQGRDLGLVGRARVPRLRDSNAPSGNPPSQFLSSKMRPKPGEGGGLRFELSPAASNAPKKFENRQLKIRSRNTN